MTVGAALAASRCQPCSEQRLRGCRRPVSAVSVTSPSVALLLPGKVLGLALECAGPRLGVTASVSPPGITLDLDQSPRPACEKGAGRSELCVSVCLCVCVWQVPRPCHVHLHVALRSLTCGSPPGSGVGVPSPFQYPAASVAKPPRERAAVACALRQPREPHLRALAGLPQPEA